MAAHNARKGYSMSSVTPAPKPTSPEVSFFPAAQVVSFIPIFPPEEPATAFAMGQMAETLRLSDLAATPVARFTLVVMSGTDAGNFFQCLRDNCGLETAAAQRAIEERVAQGYLCVHDSEGIPLFYVTAYPQSGIACLNYFVTGGPNPLQDNLHDPQYVQLYLTAAQEVLDGRLFPKTCSPADHWR